MKKWIASCSLTIGLCLLPAFASAADINPASCQEVMQNNCIKYHGIKKVCAAQKKAGADWHTIVASMGKKGQLSQEVQDQALACLTSTDKKIADQLCPAK